MPDGSDRDYWATVHQMSHRFFEHDLIERIAETLHSVHGGRASDLLPVALYNSFVMGGIPPRSLVGCFFVSSALEGLSDRGMAWLLIGAVVYVMVTIVLLLVLWRLYRGEVRGRRSSLEEKERAVQERLANLEEKSGGLGQEEEASLGPDATTHHAAGLETVKVEPETRQIADRLTGLYNLRYFYGVLEKEIQQAEWYDGSVSLIILDIDDFKAYNDLHGHPRGDNLLIELARLMCRMSRQTDTVARYGGEEFAIILPSTQIDGARFVAQRLQRAVREHRFSMQDGQTARHMSISIGVAMYPDHADDVQGLVEAADNALLQAKREGKDRMCVYEPSAGQI